MLRDFDREGEADFPYCWDEERAQNIVDWFALLRHSKGVLAGQPIVLTDWQKFFLCQIYGCPGGAVYHNVRMDLFENFFYRCFVRNVHGNIRHSYNGGAVGNTAVGIFDI